MVLAIRQYRPWVAMVVIRKKENRPEAADYGRSNPRNQRRIDFLRSTRVPEWSIIGGSMGKHSPSREC